MTARLKTVPILTEITAIYARVSLDRKNLEIGVGNQVKAGGGLCDRSGWTDRREYVDNDLSATSGGPRPHYDRLMADVEAGVIKRIVVFHLSRLWRNRRERAEGIEILKRHQMSVICVEGPHLDMSTAYGRGAAGMLGEVDTMEVELKSERQILANLARAEAGLPRAGGPRAFGFEPDGITVRQVAVIDACTTAGNLVCEEAEAIKAGYETVIGGGSLRSVARAWNRAELFSGKKKWGKNAKHREHPEYWTYDSVGDVLRNPRYAGIRTYTHLDGRVEEFTAVWDPIVPEETYQAAMAILDDPDRRPAPAMGVALLTATALCGVCDATVHSGGGRRPDSSRAHHVYRCSANSGRHIVRKAGPIEELVVDHVIGRLDAEDARDLLVDDRKPDVPALILERASIRQRMIQLAEEFADDFDPVQMRAANAKLRKRLGEIQEAITDAGRVSILGPLIEADDTRAAWDELGDEQGVDGQRAVIDKLMVVRILPVGKGCRTFRPESVDIRWRQPLHT